MKEGEKKGVYTLTIYLLGTCRVITFNGCFMVYRGFHSFVCALT